MYTITHLVPRVTSENIATIKAAAGHLAPLVRIDPIDTEERATAVAREEVGVSIRRDSQTEFISGLHGIVLDEKGENYAVTFRILGD